MGKITVAGKDLKKYKGTELFEQNLGVLPQNPQSLFVFETLRQDLEEVLKIRKFKKEEISERVTLVSKMLGLTELLDRHPYDLSGGEMQKAALAKILLLEPKILLLDEPTKGMDALSKENLGGILRGLRDDGVSVLMVTHDHNLVRDFQHRVIMLERGRIVADNGRLAKEIFRR